VTFAGDEIGDQARMLGHRIEDTAVPAEPALVRHSLRDVVEVDLGGIGRERIDPTPTKRLDLRTG
jgi:hypothetical protein